MLLLALALLYGRLKKDIKTKMQNACLKSFIIRMTVTESITLSIALVGAVLGVINTWHQLDRSRVKLRVTPKHVIHGWCCRPKFDILH